MRGGRVPLGFSGSKQRKVVQMRRKRWYSRAPIYASRCFLTNERDTLMASNATSSTTSKVETVTLRHLAETLSESHELPKKQVMSMLEDMVTTVTKHLKRGARIRIGGLGILQVRKRPARMGRNPATGEPIKIKASKKVAFRAAKDLKEAV